MKKLFIAIGTIVIGGVFYFITTSMSERNFPKLRKNRQCEFTQHVIQEDVRGVIIRTFRNTDSHFDETIELVYQGDTIRDNLFILEQTGVFEKLYVGDIILKETGTLDFVVMRDGVQTIFKLDYGCNESLDSVSK